MAVVKNLKFCCEALPVIDGYTLKALHPNEEGFYEVNIMGLECPSRNRVTYDSESLLAAMADPEGCFYKTLREGQLPGEYGHPILSNPQDLARIILLDPKSQSHYFNKVWLDDKPVRIDGHETYILKAWIKPFGPFKANLKDQLEDPHLNNSFSLRSICTSMGSRNGLEHRKVMTVVTFDSVIAGGFTCASKRYVSQEDFSVTCTEKDLTAAVASMAGNENIMLTKEEVERLFDSGKDIIQIAGNEYVMDGDLSLCSSKGERLSLASLCFRE